MGGVAAGENDHGDRIGEGLGDAAEGILGAGAVLNGDDADFLAAGHAGVAIGHVASNPLLAGHDGPNSCFGTGIDDRRCGKGEQVLNTFSLENFRNDCFGLHG